MRIGKLALAHSESGKIETQHANAAHRQPLGNVLCREVVFAAREAVREQCEGNRLAERQIDQGRQFFALGIGKLEPFGTHGWPFKSADVVPRSHAMQFLTSMPKIEASAQE